MIAVFLAAAALLAAACSLYYARRWHVRLTVNLSFSQPAVYAGRNVSFTEEVENRKRLPLPVVEVAFRIPKGVFFADAENIQISDYVYKRDLFTILGMEGITRTYEMNCEKRGFYDVTQVTLRTWNLFFSRARRKELELKEMLTVFAARTDVTDILHPLQTLLGEQISRRRYLEDPFAFASIREYTPQDPMKTLNWKATARTGSMMVNTYASVQNEQVMLYLDVEDTFIIRQEPLVEESISVAASLLSALEAKGLDVGLAVNACPPGEEEPAVFAPGRGREFVSRIERFLAQDFTKLKETPFGLLPAPDQEGRICVFITKNQTRKMADELAARTGEGREGIWVLPVFAGEKTDAGIVSSCPDLHVVIRKVS